MFFDCCVEADTTLSTRTQIVAQLHKLGYGGLAWNHHLSGKFTEKDVKLCSPVDFNPLSGAVKLNTSPKTSFKQLNRLTVLLEDQIQFQSLSPSSGILSRLIL